MGKEASSTDLPLRLPFHPLLSQPLVRSPPPGLCLHSYLSCHFPPVTMSTDRFPLCLPWVLCLSPFLSVRSCGWITSPTRPSPTPHPRSLDALYPTLPLSGMSGGSDVTSRPVLLPCLFPFIPSAPPIFSGHMPLALSTFGIFSRRCRALAFFLSPGAVRENFFFFARPHVTLRTVFQAPLFFPSSV